MIIECFLQYPNDWRDSQLTHCLHNWLVDYFVDKYVTPLFKDWSEDYRQMWNKLVDLLTTSNNIYVTYEIGLLIDLMADLTNIKLTYYCMDKYKRT
jgi:hypothetical protein